MISQKTLIDFTYAPRAELAEARPFDKLRG